MSVCCVAISVLDLMCYACRIEYMMCSGSHHCIRARILQLISHSSSTHANHNRLVGKVDLVVDKLRVDSTRVLVAEVSVGDSTGSISLRARDDQIDLLKQVSKEGGAVVLRNCTMELYQGRFLRLVVGKWGKINVYPVRRCNDDGYYYLVCISIVSSVSNNMSLAATSRFYHRMELKAHRTHLQV